MILMETGKTAEAARVFRIAYGVDGEIRLDQGKSHQGARQTRRHHL
ncbi:MAG: hypothetical protein R3D59_13185 [Paracoccaceae bacterium]